MDLPAKTGNGAGAAIAAQVQDTMISQTKMARQQAIAMIANRLFSKIRTAMKS